MKHSNIIKRSFFDKYSCCILFCRLFQILKTTNFSLTFPRWLFRNSVKILMVWQFEKISWTYFLKRKCNIFIGGESGHFFSKFTKKPGFLKTTDQPTTYHQLPTTWPTDHRPPTTHQPTIFVFLYLYLTFIYRR